MGITTLRRHVYDARGEEGILLDFHKGRVCLGSVLQQFNPFLGIVKFK